MTRAGLALLFLAAPFAFANPSGAPPQLAPCMAIDELRMTHVVRVPTYANIFTALKDFKTKRAAAKTIIEKLPTATTAPVKATKKKKRVQVCKRYSKKKKRCTWWIWVTK